MEEQREKKDRNYGYGILVLGAVSAILTMPLFIFLYKYFPEIEFYIGDNLVKLDYILLFLGIFFLTYYLLRKFRVFVVAVVLAGLLLMTITNFADLYTFKDLKNDYYTFLFDLSGDSFEKDFTFMDKKFKKETVLREAINYNDPDLRNYAASIAIKHFDDKEHLAENKKWVQFFSVFKEIYNNWKYVYDPVNEDYYSSATSTLRQLSYDDYFKGDCDDYSIMMAACIKAIGGEVRLVRTTVKRRDGTEVGHMYPEVKFGNTEDLEKIVYLIKNIFFEEESQDQPIFYFQDSKGFIWLNYDYNDAYPGGKYQSDVRESEIVI
ncbi:MAG: transglutaminase domain-containing protein [Crocinitomicaceae bacterium]